MSSYEIVVYIEKILNSRKILKSDFYNSTGVSSATMSNWRKGKNYPSMEALIEINAFLGTDFAITVDNKKSAKPELTDDERDVIRLYRNASDQTRKSMLLLLRSLEADSQLRDASSATL